MATLKISDLSVGDWVQDNYGNYVKVEGITRIPFEVGNDELGRTFSIGELIEMLPEAICESKDDDYHYFLSIETDSLTWKVFYESEDEVTLCSTFGVELVDALCSMVTMLKRQGTL